MSNARLGVQRSRAITIIAYLAIFFGISSMIGLFGNLPPINVQPRLQVLPASIHHGYHFVYSRPFSAHTLPTNYYMYRYVYVAVTSFWGLISVWMGIGMLKGRDWARDSYLLLLIVVFLVNLVFFTTLDVAIIIYGLILWRILYRSGARMFFA